MSFSVAVGELVGNVTLYSHPFCHPGSHVTPVMVVNQSCSLGLVTNNFELTFCFSHFFLCWSSEIRVVPCPSLSSLWCVGLCECTRCFGLGDSQRLERGHQEDKGLCCYLPDEINFLFSSFLAGSKHWNGCQTSGAGLHPKRRLCDGTSHGEWVHDEEPFTEAANNETTADAGRMPSASVGSCAVRLTRKDRTNWNGEITSQQTLRSHPGIAGLSQTGAEVVSPGCHTQGRPWSSAAQHVQVQICPLVCKGRIQSPPYHCCHPWSATVLGGKMQRKDAWRLSQL